MLYRKRTARRFRLASTSGVRFRYSRQKEAVRGCGGRGALWKFNRFLPDTPCQTGTLVKTPLLMLIDICLAIICVILPPAPSVLQAGSSDACVYTRGSVRRASGFVLTRNPEVMVVNKWDEKAIALTTQGNDIIQQPSWARLDSNQEPTDYSSLKRRCCGHKVPAFGNWPKTSPRPSG